MPFVKGDNRINKAGRPLGSLNRSTDMMKVSLARATNRVLDQPTFYYGRLDEERPEGGCRYCI
jgi:hypothetical protein